MANYTLERDGWCARERVPNVLFVVVSCRVVEDNFWKNIRKSSREMPRESTQFSSGFL